MPDFRSSTLLSTLLSRSYRAAWKPEPEYNLGYSHAIHTLRSRLGLSMAAFAEAAGHDLRAANIQQLELRGKPIRPEHCETFSTLAKSYGLSRLADYFNGQALSQTFRTGPGRRKTERDDVTYLQGG
jgi:hypothetical protein